MTRKDTGTRVANNGKVYGAEILASRLRQYVTEGRERRRFRTDSWIVQNDHPTTEAREPVLEGAPIDIVHADQCELCALLSFDLDGDALPL